MKTSRKMLKSVLAAGIGAAGLASFAAQAYGPLYVWDYASGTPYRWDVTTPVQVWTDGGNFASGTVSLWVETPETCNEEDGWQCGYYEDRYVEFTNEQGVARVADAVASWSSVPTSSFQAAVAGSFADLGIGGDDGDITGAPEEFSTDADGNVVQEIIGTVNGGGVHVVFDEDGSVMANVLGAPPGVLGVASPEWADEETGIITEGWVFIGGAQTTTKTKTWRRWPASSRTSSATPSTWRTPRPTGTWCCTAARRWRRPVRWTAPPTGTPAAITSCRSRRTAARCRRTFR
jgi:hypothetical protein